MTHSAETDLLAAAGFTPETMTAVDHLLVGCGGFVKELLAYTAGASTWKGGERLSAADAQVDQLLRERLMALFPGCSGYSEEGGAWGAPRAGAKVRWLVDPVDGTRPALLGGAYGICAGGLVLEGDQVVAAAGWVFVPNLPALYRGILAPGRRECTLNGRPIGCAVGEGANLGRCYMAVGSDAHRSSLPQSDMKLSAPGATSVHLTRLVHPESDVATTVLSRYRGYDAAAAFTVAAAGGCEVHVQSADGGWEDAMDPLRFLALLNADPAGWAPKALVGPPHVLRGLRG